jgi:hypothetical protein
MRSKEIKTSNSKVKMDIAGVVISLIALFFTAFTYLKHDKKIKQQSALLNNYQLDRIEKEKKEEKKAIIEANVINGLKGNRIIKIYNRGKCLARNVNVIIPESEGFHVFNNPCPIDIRPQNGIDISLGAFIENCPSTIDISFEWSDDLDKNNKDKQTIQLS